MDQSKQVELEIALHEERIQLETERIQFETEKLHWMREHQLLAPRRYRFFAWIVDVWASFLAAKASVFLISALEFSMMFFVFYFIFVFVLTKRYGQSIGKMAFELKVVHETADTLDWGVIFVREWIGRVVTLITVFGLFFPFYHKKQRALYDLMTMTSVISVESVSKRNRKG